MKIAEIKKGCGKRFKDGNINWNCGDKIGCNELLPNSEVLYLCPICQAKLTQAIEDTKEEIDWLYHQKGMILSEMEVAKKWNTNNARQSEIMLMMFLTQINKRIKQKEAEINGK